MQPVALNGLMLYVTSVAHTLAVYEKLGFTVIHRDSPTFGSVMLGEMLLQFQDKRNPSDPDFVAEAMVEPKGGGIFCYLQVEDIDGYYQAIIERGVVPTTKPRDWPSGNREFVVRDPDGYKLVFYQLHGARDIRHQHLD
ncbi:VOC family protein [Candidatus Berkelbacteria bacterium]|nr:VOC family protein [Candidatus Berkelbacteria bacterium]